MAFWICDYILHMLEKPFLKCLQVNSHDTLTMLTDCSYLHYVGWICWTLPNMPKPICFYFSSKFQQNWSFIINIIIITSYHMKLLFGRVPYTKCTWHPVYKPDGTGLKNLKCFHWKYLLVANSLTAKMDFSDLKAYWFLETNWRGKWMHFIYIFLNVNISWWIMKDMLKLKT